MYLVYSISLQLKRDYEEFCQYFSFFFKSDILKGRRQNVAFVTVSNLSKTYVADPIFEDLSFRIEAGEKVGLIGNNGTGKTTLMEILADIIGKDSGEVRYQKDLEIGYLSQHATVEDEATVYDSCMENFRDLIELEKQLRNMEEEMSHLQGDELEIHMNRYSRKMEYFEEKGDTAENLPFEEP